MRHLVMDSPIDPLCILEEDGFITRIDFGAEPPAGSYAQPSPILEKSRAQLEEYFNGKRRDFDLPLDPKGTPYMLKVWKALQSIPYGKTASYKDVAEATGDAKACRAVGQANNRNPLPIVIPCHRVVGADGKLAGYGGGTDIKIKLLRLEGVNLAVEEQGSLL